MCDLDVSFRPGYVILMALKGEGHVLANDHLGENSC